MSQFSLKFFTRTRNALLGLAALLVVAGGGIIAYSAYSKSPQHEDTLVFSNKEMLYELWSAYKSDVIEPGSHRTLDSSQGNVTTSEGQSYTMLRAVWEDDKTTYDQSLQWTQNNIQRPDYLFSWRYGQKPDGTYGPLTAVGGQNTASDGDTDIALSLLMAYERWGDDRYLKIAQTVIPLIWQNEVVAVAGKPVMTADNLEKNSPTTVVVNPSYFSPYAYKLFAKVDPAHNWESLADNSYAVLGQAMDLPIDKSASSGLPPNWIIMNRDTGVIQKTYKGKTDSNYGYDAFRIPFRLALDYQWFNDARDKQLLSKMNFLSTQWTTTGKINAVYSHDGKTVAADQNPATYGANIGYFVVMQPNQAVSIYNQKLVNLYDPNRQTWKTALGYYDDNWAWFGMALAQHALPNIALNKK
jgi:endo-1,4-beta-D-glucanase Y